MWSAPPDTDVPAIERGPGSIASASRSANAGVSPRHRHGGGLGNVERGLKLVPLRLAVREMRGPCDVGVVGGQFADDAALRVVAVDAEARGLPLQGAGRITVIFRLLERRIDHLGTDEELALAVADARDADGRMDRRADDFLINARCRVDRRLRLRRLAGRHPVDVAALLGRRRVDGAAGIRDRAQRFVVLGDAPDIPGQVLAVFRLAARIDVLLRQDQIRDMDRRADRFFPAHRRLVDGEGRRIGAELDVKAKAGLTGL